MHDAISNMLSRYECRSANDFINALREILQEIALLGLWRGKFFEKAAFYGGTALRILYGLDRFSEDIDFSLLEQSESFDINGYAAYLQKECEAFGFEVVGRRERYYKDNFEDAILMTLFRLPVELLPRVLENDKTG